MHDCLPVLSLEFTHYHLYSAARKMFLEKISSNEKKTKFLLKW